MKIEKTAYGGWDDCVRLSDGSIELVVTLDVGPRIIRFGFVGKANELCEVKEELGLTGGEAWRLYGGHRLWHGPEDRIRTYRPDNGPVGWEEIPGGVRTIQETETLTGIQKEMEITLAGEGSSAGVLHRLTNRGPETVELSAWAITAMAAGGKEVVPQPRRDTGLLPNRLISLWPYSRLDDPRVRWGTRYVTLRPDPARKAPFKFGLPNEDGWAAYFNRGRLFFKRYRHFPDALYPDFGVSCETYTNGSMLELETLSPLTRLEPGAAVEHKEWWELFEGTTMPSDDEGEIGTALAPFLAGKSAP